MRADLVVGDGRQKRPSPVVGNLRRLFIVHVVEPLQLGRPVDPAVADEAALATDEGTRDAVVPALPVEQEVATAGVQLADDQFRLECGVVQLEAVESVEQGDNLQLVGGQHARRAQLSKLL